MHTEDESAAPSKEDVWTGMPSAEHKDTISHPDQAHLKQLTASSLRIPEPSAVSSSQTNANGNGDENDDNDLEATELSLMPEIPARTKKRQDSGEGEEEEAEEEEPSTAQDGVDPFGRPVYARMPTTPNQRQKDSWIRRFWRHNVRVAVPHENCRDHLALERTYLAWVRTSTNLANVGVAVAQLLRLQRDPVPGPGFTLYNFGRGLGAMFVGVAITVVSIGAIRFFKQQGAMTLGKVWAAGWELHTAIWMHVAAVLVLFVVILAAPYS